ncbi:MAG: aminotransferase class I/II-fold pyridoxal phosphate-dependent enzyme [Clostridia bacterium]|nr:aminotransferase class I/II-fold pyridoxal phosphate-dependent enzyme [Clostridia bacterium]
MKPYADLTKAQQQAELVALQEQYQQIKARGLSLNMARGKPSSEQLDIVNGMLTTLSAGSDCYDGKLDVRNYGELMGIPSARALFADILDTVPEKIMVGGSASLQLMFDLISKAYTHGLLHSPTPWAKLDTVKFLCPAPGYDRHFTVSSTFGMELVYVPMTENGPDMDKVEELVQDPTVKGIWCVPKYSNPDGIIYSKDTIERFIHLQPAAPDFTIMWDNAYCIHEVIGDYVPFPDILSLAAQAGTEDMFYEFASTSKITFPGAGISCMAASVDNIQYIQRILSAQIISYDKVNQLRHVKYLKDKAHTLELMQEHAKVLGPKFQAVLDALDREIAPLNIATWRRPKGGYFVSFYAMPGTAKRIFALCKEAGLVMTNAGATYPYGKDPADSNLRIAPSYPPLQDLQQAMEIFCLCTKIAALEKLLG